MIEENIASSFTKASTGILGTEDTGSLTSLTCGQANWRYFNKNLSIYCSG